MDIVVGTAGHIDHGKTALVKALTGVDADRLPEEKKRGITIDIGFAELRLGDHHVSFVDVPGHERFVKNMLAGASGIDVVLLVVAADEGVMPQTREHFDICRLLGIRSGIVALTKADLVDNETLELARLDVADLVEGSFLADSPIVPVSSKTGDGIDDLRNALEAAASGAVERPSDLAAFLPIDRSFPVKGFGTVVTGTLSSGEIKLGDELEMLPSQRFVRVRGLQSHGSLAETAQAGRRVAVNLAGVDYDEIRRGEILAAPGLLRPTQIIDVWVDVLQGSPRPLRSRQRIRVHIGTAEILARVQVLNDEGAISTGERDFAQLRLESPVACRLGDRFILRSYSPQTTIAGGVVLDPLAAKHRKREFTAARATLEKLAEPGVPKGSAILAYVEASGGQGLSQSGLAARTGCRSSVIKASVEPLISNSNLVRAGELLITSVHLSELQTKLLAKLDTHHKKEPLSKGMSREELRPAWAPAEIFDSAIDDLRQKDKVDVLGDTISIASKKADLSPEDELIHSRIVARLKDAGLQVPKIDDLLGEAIAGTKAGMPHAKKILFLLFDSSEAVKISEEFVFSRAVIDELVAKLRDHASRGDRTVDVPKFKDIAGVSRKYAIPLLEYFDREKVTLRTGDKRVIR